MAPSPSTSRAESLRRTTLGDLRAGDAVNLERSLASRDRLSGHFVFGHVDGVGTCARSDRRGERALLASRSRRLSARSWSKRARSPSTASASRSSTAAAARSRWPSSRIPPPHDARQDAPRAIASTSRPTCWPATSIGAVAPPSARALTPVLVGSLRSRPTVRLRPVGATRGRPPPTGPHCSACKPPYNRSMSQGGSQCATPGWEHVGVRRGARRHHCRLARARRRRHLRGGRQSSAVSLALIGGSAGSLALIYDESPKRWVLALYAALIVSSFIVLSSQLRGDIDGAMVLAVAVVAVALPIGFDLVLSDLGRHLEVNRRLGFGTVVSFVTLVLPLTALMLTQAHQRALHRGRRPAPGGGAEDPPRARHARGERARPEQAHDARRTASRSAAATRPTASSDAEFQKEIREYTVRKDTETPGRPHERRVRARPKSACASS